MKKVFSCWLALLILASTTHSFAASERPVILATDCGADMDDQWALAHLALSPRIDLLGVVSTHAFNLAAPAAETSARIAREVLAQLPGPPQTPVIPGSSVALTNATTPIRNPGVDFILAQSRNFSSRRRLAVLVIGAATDVASALILDPTLADRIEIVSMAYTSWPDGGDEWNVKNDPSAWAALLDSRAPITVGDGSVTRRDLAMTSARAGQFLNNTGPAGMYLLGLLNGWLSHNSGAAPQGAWPVWDEVTTAYLLGYARTRTYPRPRLGPDMKFTHPQTSETIRWVTSIDAPRLWGDLRARLIEAER